METGNFTQGRILGPLLKFTVPVILALLLQSLYGAVDLLIVGHFAQSADVSAVSTGAQIMQTITGVVAGLAMGTTILLGQLIGEGNGHEAGKAVGASIMFFAAAAAVLSAVMLVCTRQIASVMNAPAEAFEATCSYIRICSAGLIFITAYNVLGSLFRGIGNSRLPLVSVAIAAVFNVFGDYFMVKVLGMGASGAAYATIAAQAFSVLISFAIIKRISLPFAMSRQDVRMNMSVIRRIVGFGAPLAFSDLLVGLSFLIILAIVNSLGLLASAGVGVAEKVCAFIMLIPSAFSQAMATFAAQNYGAGKMKRAVQGLKYGIGCSLAIGAVMAYLSFFHGDLLCDVFTKDAEVAYAGWQYLKAYAIDTILVSFIFCLMGFFNGCGFTKFVMMQSLACAFLARIPYAWIMSKFTSNLFLIGLASPVASVLGLILLMGYLILCIKNGKIRLDN